MGDFDVIVAGLNRKATIKNINNDLAAIAGSLSSISISAKINVANTKKLINEQLKSIKLSEGGIRTSIGIKNRDTATLINKQLKDLKLSGKSLKVVASLDIGATVKSIREDLKIVGAQLRGDDILKSATPEVGKKQVRSGKSTGTEYAFKASPYDTYGTSRTIVTRESIRGSSLNNAYNNLQSQIVLFKNRLGRKYQNTIFGEELVRIQKSIAGRDESYGNISFAKEEFNALKTAAKLAGVEVEGLASKIGKLFVKHIGTSIALTGVALLSSSLREVYANVVKVNTAMTELKKVTNESSASYARYLETSAKVSKEIATPLSEYITATADFARLGYSMGDSAEMAKAASVYKNVGDGIESISDASNSIIATMKAFNIGADMAMNIVDKYNEVGNNFAISSQGIGVALQKSAAALQAGNTSIDEAIALAVAANTTIQNPEVVGTVLKTVSMYLRASKTDAEAAGEATDGMANSVSQLRAQLMQLTNNRVDIMKNATDYKSTYEILKDISSVWSDIADVDQANILQLIGGKRNASVLAGLLNNFKDAEAALRVSEGASGSALAENEKYIRSINGALAQLASTFEVTSQTLLHDESVIHLVHTLSGLLEVLNAIVDVTGSISLVSGAFAGLRFKSVIDLAGESALNIKTLRLGLSDKKGKYYNPLPLDISNRFAMLGEKQQRSYEAMFAALINEGSKEGGKRYNKLLQKFTDETNTATKATGRLWGVLKANPLAAVSTAIAVISFGVQQYRNYIQKLEEEAANSAASAKDTSDEIDTYNDYIEQINNAANDTSALISIKQQLIDKFGDEAAAIRATTDELTNYVDGLKKVAYSEWWKDNSDNWRDAGSYLDKRKYGWRSIGSSYFGSYFYGDEGYNKIKSFIDAINEKYGNILGIISIDGSLTYDTLGGSAIPGLRFNLPQEYSLLQVEQTWNEIADLVQSSDLPVKFRDSLLAPISDVIGKITGDSRYVSYKEILSSYGDDKLLSGDWADNKELSDNVIAAYMAIAKARDEYLAASTTEEKSSALFDLYTAIDNMRGLIGDVETEDNTLAEYIKGILLPEAQGYLDQNPLLVKIAIAPFGKHGIASKNAGVAFAGQTYEEIIGQYEEYLMSNDSVGSEMVRAFSSISFAARDMNISPQDYIKQLFDAGLLSNPTITDPSELAAGFYNVINKQSEGYNILQALSGAVGIDNITQDDLATLLQERSYLQDNFQSYLNGNYSDMSTADYMGGQDVLNDFKKSMGGMVDGFQGIPDTISASAQALNDMNEEMASADWGDTTDEIEKCLNVLDDTSSTAADQEEAWDGIQKALGSLTDDSFPKTAENLKLIEDAVSGDEAAISKLQEIAAKGVLLNAGSGNVDFSTILAGLATVDALGQSAVNALTASGLFHIEYRPMRVMSSDGTIIENETGFIVPNGSSGPSSGGKKSGGGGGGKKSITRKSYDKDIKALEDLINLLARLSNYYEEGSDKWVERQTEIIDKYKQAAAITEAEYERLLAKGYDATNEEMRALADTLAKYKDAVFKESEALFDALRERDIKALEDQIDSINDLIDAEEERWEKREEQLEHEIDMQTALIGLEKEQVDLTSELRKAQADLDKQLASSKALEAYTDESQRNLMFNDDDYAILSEKLQQIALDADAMYADYLDKIANVGVDNTYDLEYITNEYERQYELKLKEYEIAREELELEKARLNLENALNNRNTRMFINGKWQMVADPDAVKNATESVKDAEAELEEAAKSKEELIRIQELEAIRDSLGQIKDKEEFEYEKLIEVWQDQIEELEDQIDVLREMKFSMDFLAEEIHSLVDSIQEVIMGALSDGSIKAIREVQQFSSGGVDSTGGLKILHGTKQNAEVVFNSADAQKLYDFVHGSSDILNSLLYGGASVSGIKPLRTVNNMDNLYATNSRTVQDNRVYVAGIQIEGADGQALIDIFRRNSLLK